MCNLAESLRDRWIDVSKLNLLVLSGQASQDAVAVLLHSHCCDCEAGLGAQESAEPVLTWRHTKLSLEGSQLVAFQLLANKLEGKTETARQEDGAKRTTMIEVLSVLNSFSACSNNFCEAACGSCSSAIRLTAS